MATYKFYGTHQIRGPLKVGKDQAGYDVTFFGATANAVMVWDTSADELYFDGADLWLKDSDQLEFGDASDVIMRWDGTDFDIVAAADDSVFKFGDGTKSFDIWFYGNTANDNVILDASANKVNFDGIDLILEDNDFLIFGDGSDAQISWDATRLVLEPKYTLHVGKSTDSTYNEVHVFDGGAASGPAAMVLYDEQGTAHYLWVDTTGDVRVHTAHPGTDSTSAGTVVGTQT